MTLTADQRARLNANLPPDKIREREGPGGRPLSYVEGWDAIDVLNDVVGAGEWGYDTTATIAVPLEERPGKFGPRWGVTYVSKCCLTIRGCEPIGDYGVGHGQDKDPGLAIESAIKEAATDSLKRCAKSLGHRLGLALYDKKREHVGDEPPTHQRPAKSSTDIAPIVAAFATVKPGQIDWCMKMIDRANEIEAGLSQADFETVGRAISEAKARAGQEPTKAPPASGAKPLPGKRNPSDCVSVPELSTWIAARRDMLSTLPVDERALVRSELVVAAKRLGIDHAAMLTAAGL